MMTERQAAYLNFKDHKIATNYFFKKAEEELACEYNL